MICDNTDCDLHVNYIKYVHGTVERQGIQDEIYRYSIKTGNTKHKLYNSAFDSLHGEHTTRGQRRTCSISHQFSPIMPSVLVQSATWQY